MSRFDPAAWEAVGISAREGERWHEQRIQPADALRWRRAGVIDPRDAVGWTVAGVDPRAVREWRYAEIDARQAVVWTELGFSAARARKHKRAGRSPAEANAYERRVTAPFPSPPPGVSLSTQAPGGGVVHMHSAPTSYVTGGPSQPMHPAHRFMVAVRRRAQRRHHVIAGYMERQWFDDEAIAWATEGIEAAEALAWKELGLSPAEAGRHQDEGQSAMQTAKAWWDAGIPFGEVGAWIGAGLTPSEAAQQRAAGVTVEQVAVLRSLRGGSQPPAR